MNNRSRGEQNFQIDSLDVHKQEFNRSKHYPNHQGKQESVYKNYYKQQLDEILQQKNQFKSLQKQNQQQQRRIYNERLRLGQQAQRVKQISYKNYYQMIMNNQQNMKNHYVSPFQQREQQKEKFIHKGVEIGMVRSNMDHQREINRQSSIKKEFQTVLNHQLNQKEQTLRKQSEEKHKINHHLKTILLSPQDVQRLERQKKLAQMNKYKEDLDKLKIEKYSISQSQFQNPQLSPSKSKLNSDRHNALLNPVPFNIQNPYILKQMQKKNMYGSNTSFQTVPDTNQYSPTKRNIFG